VARVWALAGLLLAAPFLVFLMVGFLGSQALLFAGPITGAGAAAAFIPGGVALSRGIWLGVGVIFGSLGFALGALTFPDTNFGLFLGAAVPVLICAFAAMWTKKPEVLITLVLGAGSMGAIYAQNFNIDPQALNYALPIAIGQALVPIAFGYLAGAIFVTFMGAETPQAAEEEDDGDGDSDTPQDETQEVAV